jgi:uncharacterized membrane protein YqjE
MKRGVKWTFFVVASLMCLVLILCFPLNRYEWILDFDPNETLPLDDKATMYPFFAGMPVSLLILFFVFTNSKVEKMIALTVLTLLGGVWLLKFHAILF